MDKELRVTLKGHTGAPLELKNPVLTASGTFGYGLEFMPYGNLASLGGIVVKGLSLDPREGNPMPRIAETTCGMLNAVGLQNCGVEIFLRDKLPHLPTKQLPVIANLYATSVSDFADLGGILAAEPGIAALEVNISCPNVKEGGAAFGHDPRMAEAVTTAVKKRAGSTPVIVKLSPNVTNITAIAKACEEGGADILSCINTLIGMAVDLPSRRPLLANIIGGLSGPAIKPVALRCVWQVSRAVSIPVIGIGGIRSAEDVLEFILAGAHAVQVGTANFTRPDAAFRIAAALPAAMKKYGITSWDTFRGDLRLY
jgi:dihydroorotate dehydrogenase (NAD+) catalytic subunit